jgi:seryl-tRNA synthetase
MINIVKKVEAMRQELNKLQVEHDMLKHKRDLAQKELLKFFNKEVCSTKQMRKELDALKVKLEEEEKRISKELEELEVICAQFRKK